MNALGRVVIFAVVILVLVSGCGYRLQGSGTTLPDDIKTIYIPLVDNDTTEPGLSIQFTEVLRGRFDRYGVIKVVEDKNLADAIFKAKIRSITSQVRGVTSRTDVEVQVALTMIVDAELRRRNGQVLWKAVGFMASEEYASTSDTVVTSSSDFAQSGISASSLGALSSREVARGQSEEAINALMEEVSRQLYLNSVAADF